MNRQKLKPAFVLLVAALGFAFAQAALAQSGTAFAYQGRLEDNGVAITATYDFQFRLCADANCTSGSAPIVNGAVLVKAGVFTTAVDFGAAFTGQAAFLEISTRRTSVGGPFQLLLPRQAINPVPGAQHAQLATAADTDAVGSAAIVDSSVASIDIANGTVGSADINTAQVQQRVSGTCAAGSSISSITSSGTVTCEIDSVGTFTGWNRTGNAGINPATDFVGTTDAQPLELRTGGLRAWRAVQAGDANQGSTNILAGSASNTFGPGVIGGTIAGGGGTDAGVSLPNQVRDVFGTVSGGVGNRTGINGYATVSGGGGNLASGSYATVVGGKDNIALGAASTAAGGFNVAGGEGSVAMGLFAKVRTPAGSGVPPEGGVIGDIGTFIFADNQFSDFISTGTNQFLVRASGGVAFTNAQLPAGQPSSGKFLIDAQSGVGLNMYNPGGTIHVRRGDSGVTSFGANSAAIFEGSGTTYVRVVAPDTSERGLLFSDNVTNNDGGILYNTASVPNGLQFRTSGTSTRLVVTSGGKVGIGRIPNATTGNQLELEGDASKTFAGSWLSHSDARIKRDVAEVDSALATLSRLRAVTFRYTPAYLAQHPTLVDRRYYNVIAQEFAEVFPDAVKRSGEQVPGMAKGADSGILQVDTHPAFITAIAAIQELAVRNERLERDNAALEARLERVEAMLR